LIDEPCLIVGRKGSIGATYISNESCWPIDTTYYIIPPEELKLEFLYYYMFVLQTERLDKSTSIPSLSRDDVYEIEMGIPPLREQELIVSKIEELFSQIDVATSEVKETKEKLTNYKIALHEAATTGQLTSEWRTHDDTSATERIEQIEKERYEKWEHYEREKKKKRGENVETDRWKKKYDSPAELPVDDLPDLPEAWTWTTLDTVTAYDVDYRSVS
jgi:type I restriction enzyme S subunit